MRCVRPPRAGTTHPIPVESANHSIAEGYGQPNRIYGGHLMARLGGQIVTVVTI